MKVKLIRFIGIIIVCIILFILWTLKQPCKRWEKPKNVPISAIWKGGCDGGNWIELVDIRTDTIRFRIYRDWSGELILDADFVLGNCNILHLTRSNWDSCIDYFDGERLYYRTQTINSHLQLIPILPAYYEDNKDSFAN